MSEPSLQYAPPPWRCKCTSYILFFHTSSSQQLPQNKILAPLEASSKLWTDEKFAGKHRGGLGVAWIVRYTDTPVGSYDELVIQPGNFEAPHGLGCKGKFMRITGIWVSQEATCMNGRKNWNIPKHIARFKFTPTSSSPLPLKVEVSEPSSEVPFFSATIHPTTWTPSFPFNSNWQGYLGLPTNLLQPPLPSGSPEYLEVGTDKWALSSPGFQSKKCRIVWMDMEQTQSPAQARQGANEADSLLKGKTDNWWPGFGRWRLGMACEDATLELGHPELFDPVQK